MAILLGIDFETTGLDTENDRIIEAGAVLWCTDRKKPLRILSENILADYEINTEIQKITGITKEMLQPPYAKYDLEACLALLAEMTKTADYVIAHNAPYDKAILEAEAKRLKRKFPEKHWIDSRTDIPFSIDIKTSALKYLCTEHGFLNPFAHRALFDVLSMLKITSYYDFDTILSQSKEPLLEFIAHVSIAEKDEAKKMGFFWNPTRKIWYQNAKESRMSQFTFPFEVSSVPIST